MYVIINGVSSDTIQGLQVLSLPPITKPKMRRQVDTIDGRAGDIITELGYEAYDRTITVLLHHNYDLDAITAFFNTSGEIIFSNEPDKKYYFRLLEKIDYERAVQFKTANITFHVQPYKYPVNETPLTVSSTAWEGTDYDQTPYIFRAVSDSSVEVGNREVIEQITGGTVAWNQLITISTKGTATIAGLTITNNGDGSFKISGTATNATINYWILGGYWEQSELFKVYSGHKYFEQDAYFFSGTGGISTPHVIPTLASRQKIAQVTETLPVTGIRVPSAVNGTAYNMTIYPMLIDLTQLFGTAIADYIYSLETATAGAGVSLFKSLFTKDYYPYNAGELMSVKTSAHKTYDANDNVLGNYPISPIELRGIPQLVSNKLQYDGDIYKADGSVERRYGVVVIDENSPIRQHSTGDTRFYVAKNDMKRRMNYLGYVICDRLQTVINHNSANENGFVSGFANATGYIGQNWVYFSNGVATTIADIKTWLASNPLTVVYELATPTTESTTPYTETQICDADGTEEFIDDRDVQIPVGHKTKYKQINDPAELTVPNMGNIPSAPTIQLTGSGTVGVYLGNAQTLQVNIPEDGITIDTEAQDATSNGQLANRSVTGDYDSVRLQPGDNDVSFSGNVSAVITNYTRWV